MVREVEMAESNKNGTKKAFSVVAHSFDSNHAEHPPELIKLRRFTHKT